VTITIANGPGLDPMNAEVDRAPAERVTDAEIDERDGLAYRTLRNEQLTPEEAARLVVLNKRIEAELPKPQGLPPDVVAAMAEARRLLGEMEEP